MEDLILLSYVLGILALGVVLGNLLPLEELREALGIVRPRAHALSDVLRGVLQAPAAASDLDLVNEVLRLKQAEADAQAKDAAGAGDDGGPRP